MGPVGTAVRLSVALWLAVVSAMALASQFLSIGSGHVEWDAALVGGLATAIGGGLLETWAGAHFTPLERVLWWAAIATLLVYLVQYLFPMTTITVWGAFLGGITVGLGEALLPPALLDR